MRRRFGNQAVLMRRLYLLRHAKSSWEDPGLDDFERPLAPRGIKACESMKPHIRDARIEPGLILCSPAVRARETYVRVAGAFPCDTEVRFEIGLYAASSHVLLSRLRQVDRAVPSIMMIGHNPGIEQLALELTGDTETTPVARMRKKYPTLALACIEISSQTWAAAGPECARLSSFVVPRDL